MHRREAPPTLTLKVRQISTGNVYERKLAGNQKLTLAETVIRSSQYIYSDNDLFYFMDNESFEQFSTNKDLLKDSINFFSEGDFFSAIGGRFLNIPVSVYIMLVVYLMVCVVLKYTAYGKRVYAVGGNPQASYISGIDVRMVRFWGMVISSLAAGLAGIIFVAQVGATVPTAGNTGLMDVVTAVILGGISLSGGKGRIEGTLIGVLILAVLSNGMVLTSVQGYYQMLVKGVVILLAVYVDSLRGGGFK